MNKIFSDFLNLCFRFVGTFLFISCAFITIVCTISALTDEPAMIIVGIIFGIFTYFLWRNNIHSNPKKRFKHSTTNFSKDNKSNEYQQVYFKHDRADEETKQNFVQNHSYSTTKPGTTNPIQTSMLLQHINDSYNIVCSTSSPETLCSRYEFGFKRCYELKKMEENSLYHGNPDANYYLSLFSQENYQKSILSCYDRYLKKAKSELKTEKSINKRIDKFWDIIKSHVDELTYSEIKKANNTRYQQDNTSSPSDTKHITDNNEDIISYTETDTLIYRTDGQLISDEEVPYLIQLGYEEALKNNNIYNREILDLSFMQARDKNKSEYTRIPTYKELSDIESFETSVSLADVLFLEYLNGFPLKNPLIAQKWYYEYNLNYTKTIKKLISNGLLNIEHASIDRLNIKDLKDILKKFNQPTNGKKSVLQSRIYANVSQKEIDSYFNNAKFFSVTLKGKELIKNMKG